MNLCDARACAPFSSVVWITLDAARTAGRIE
jgi:hypothetical protein